MLVRIKKMTSLILALSCVLLYTNVQAATMCDEYVDGVKGVLKQNNVATTNGINHEVLDNGTKRKVMGGISNVYDKLGLYGLQDYFDPQDVTELSGLKASDYAKIINGTALEGYGYAFEEVEKKYGVNGLFVLGICIIESGWGTSSLAVNKNNFTGMSAYDGNAFASAKKFKDLEECVDYTASRLKENYITRGGKFYVGGTSIFDINVYYCSQSDWAFKIISVIQDEVREHLYIESAEKQVDKTVYTGELMYRLELV